jgi:hypothetical protein
VLVGGQAQGGGGGDCGDNTTGPAEVYAHSASTLYRIDATSKAATVVGNFKGCNGSVIDLALDREGQMFGTTFGSLVRIDKTSASCTTVREGSYPNSLSFVPAGTIFPDREALVGYQGATYVRIDTATGALVEQGSLGNNSYVSSGDVVSVIGGGTYLTVRGGGCEDCIVEVNPVTGQLVTNLGSLNYAEVFGLAFWGGEIYGFNSAGQLFVFDVVSKNTKALQIPGGAAGLSFFGAGSTTCARLTKPIN